MISIARPAVNINFTLKKCVNVNYQISVLNKTCLNIIQVPFTRIYTHTDRFIVYLLLLQHTVKMAQLKITTFTRSHHTSLSWAIGV